MEIKRYFYINLHLKYPLDIEFIACYSELMPEREREREKELERERER